MKDDNQVYWFATVLAQAGEKDVESPKAKLSELLSDWHPPIVSIIEATEDHDILRTDMYDMLPPLERWSSGRFCILMLNLIYTR